MIQGYFKPVGQPQLEVISSTGHYIHFADGTVLYDCHAGRGANVLGHNLPELINIRSKSYTCDWDFAGPTWRDLEAELNLLIGPEYELIIPALTGTDAVDIAIRIAWWINGPGTVQVRPNTYHSGSISGWQQADISKTLTSKWVEHKWFTFSDNYENLNVDNVAAVLVDSVSWVDGLKTSTQSFWNNLQEQVNKSPAVFIADEVLTGFGKLGSWSHFKQMGLTPDILVFGKALTAGHENLSLVCVHKKIKEKIDGQWLAAGNTRSFNEVGAAVALATIRIIKEQDLLNRINTVITPALCSLANKIDKKYNPVAVGNMLSFSFNDPNLNEKFNKEMQAQGFWHQYLHPYIHVFYNATDEELYNLSTAILQSISTIE